MQDVGSEGLDHTGSAHLTNMEVGPLKSQNVQPVNGVISRYSSQWLPHHETWSHTWVIVKIKNALVYSLECDLTCEKMLSCMISTGYFGVWLSFVDISENVYFFFPLSPNLKWCLVHLQSDVSVDRMAESADAKHQQPSVHDSTCVAARTRPLISCRRRRLIQPSTVPNLNGKVSSFTHGRGHETGGFPGSEWTPGVGTVGSCTVRDFSAASAELWKIINIREKDLNCDDLGGS